MGCLPPSATFHLSFTMHACTLCVAFAYLLHAFACHASLEKLETLLPAWAFGLRQKNKDWNFLLWMEGLHHHARMHLLLPPSFLATSIAQRTALYISFAAHLFSFSLFVSFISFLFSLALCIFLLHFLLLSSLLFLQKFV